MREADVVMFHSTLVGLLESESTNFADMYSDLILLAHNRRKEEEKEEDGCKLVGWRLLFVTLKMKQLIEQSAGIALRHTHKYRRLMTIDEGLAKWREISFYLSQTRKFFALKTNLAIVSVFYPLQITFTASAT